MTTETKHTSGPWLYRESFFGASGIGTPAISHGDTSAFMCWLNMSGAYGGNSGIDRARADARLIAAAPDLLAALQELLTYDRVERPAFRNKPIGAPNSNERIKQDKLIQVEDMARAAIERATKG